MSEKKYVLIEGDFVRGIEVVIGPFDSISAACDFDDEYWVGGDVFSVDPTEDAWGEDVGINVTMVEPGVIKNLYGPHKDYKRLLTFGSDFYFVVKVTSPEDYVAMLENCVDEDDEL